MTRTWAGCQPAATGALLQVILEFKTLLIGQGLMRAGLADVDDGQAPQVEGLDGLVLEMRS